MEIKIEIHEPPHPDMPAWSYMESDEFNGRQWRRVRRIKVFQFNRIVDYIDDMGPSQYTVSGGEPAFVIPGGVRKSNGHYESLHSVGELQDIAEQYKLASAWHEEFLGQTHDLAQLYHDEQERRRSVKVGRKVYARRSPRS